jgi:hypothetical protein
MNWDIPRVLAIHQIPDIKFFNSFIILHKNLF